MLIDVVIQVQFGHAGSCANADSETATTKNQALQAAGVHVPSSFDDLGETIRLVEFHYFPITLF